MLKQGSVLEVRRQRLPRKGTKIIITMCYYPRGIKKEWRDEFIHILAPDRGLFKEWKEFEKQAGHEEAFRRSHYEERFNLSPLALDRLKNFSNMSRTMDIYFVCQCEVGERCHREMLLITAHKLFGAPVDCVFHDYPIFESRLAGALNK